LKKDSRSVSRVGIASGGAAVQKTAQHLDSTLNDRMCLFTIYIGQKPDASSVVLVAEIVKSLLSRAAIVRERIQLILQF
jgi:hypothetical protein